MEINFNYGSWNEVRKCWEDYLWPGRDDIEPIVGQTIGEPLSYDSSIEKSEVSFFVAKCGNKVIGVNSGFNTTPDYYRSRGLWVHKSFRRKGVALKLLQMTIEDAIHKKNLYVWTIPRESALSTYEKAGFKKVSEFINENMKYGPNCYALWSLDRSRI